jgi:glycosyltransferase involved in cell wall biosynthesis
MHIGVEATTLRSRHLGGVWRYTESLITALGRLPSPHRYSLLYINAFKPWRRVQPPVVGCPQFQLVEVTSVSNLLFTFLAPIVIRRRTTPAVESFLGPVDVFHSVNAVLLPQRHGRQVLTVHDLTCLTLPQFHPWRRRALFRLGIRRAVRQSDAIIVPSRAAKQDLVTFFPWSEGKTEVIPEAPGEQFVPLSPEQGQPVASRYGLTYGGYLLFVGNVEPRKNLIALIDAYNALRMRMPAGPDLVIAGGRGWRNGPIHRAAARSPYGRAIRFLGYVPEPDLPALINGAIALVYPSMNEGFGLPPLEAMACGTPVISSNRSSLPETTGDAALLVDPDDRAALIDAMATAVSDKALREDLRERGLQQAKRFSWDETARLTLRVYEGFRA